MAWKNRIVEQRTMPISELQPNPANWRAHPKRQSDALSGVLDDVGLVQGVIYNRRTGQLIDGHLRLELAKKKGVEVLPVTVVDMDEADERLILATLDPIGALADTDRKALDKLLAEVEANSDAVLAALATIGEVHGIKPPQFDPVDQDKQGSLDKKQKATCPECGHEFVS